MSDPAPDPTTTSGNSASALEDRKGGVLLGAIFLMATSAIGPGFITQTTTFTAQLGASFAFVILMSVVIDIALQLNVWRVVGVSGLRAQELGNRVLPGLGWVLAVFVVIGGLVFNIGNVSGAGLGTDAMFGLSPKWGGAISALLAVAIFLSRRAGVALDRVVVALGVVMILMMLYVAIVSQPPVGEALKRTVLPENVGFLAITTLVGGTVGGYITYAGAHRMVDSGVSGPGEVKEITRSSVTGVLITGLMRVLLFLAVFGVVAAGVTLAEDNPTASAFEHAAGEIGVRVFGVILWAASITSVIGASYTSVSFLTTFAGSARLRNWLTIAFIAVSTVIFLLIDETPVTLLIFAGAFNGLILPIGIAVILWVALRRRDLLRGYVYPRWLVALGLIAWATTIYLGWESLSKLSTIWS